MCKPSKRTISANKVSVESSSKDPEIGIFVALLTYLSYAVLIALGHLRDFVGTIVQSSRYHSESKQGYAVLLKSWESFYTRRLYHRIQDCWNRPICSSPGAIIRVMERTTSDGNYTLQTTAKKRDCTNLGSYNYLGMFFLNNSI